MPIDHLRARPRAPRSPEQTHARSERALDAWCDRLRGNGATPEEIDATIRMWDQFDDDFTPADQALMTRWGDARIRRELAAVRSEFVTAAEPT